MLSRLRVPCGWRVLMLVNWLGGTRGQNFSFLSRSSWELWAEQPKSPSSSSSLSPARQRQSDGMKVQDGGRRSAAAPWWTLTSQGVLQAAAQDRNLDLLAAGAGPHVDVDHGEIM